MSIKRLAKEIGGQGIVEFAMVLPLLLLLVFGIVDLSRWAYYNSLLSQSARETSRSVAVGNTLVAITQEIKDSIKPLTGNVTSTVSTATDNEGKSCTRIIFSPSSGHGVMVYITPVYSNGLKMGDTIRIRSEYTMDFITPLTNVFGSVKELQGVYYTRMENPPS